MDVGLVCDGCSAFNELGAPSCVSCQQQISLDGDGGAADAPAAGGGLACPLCAASVAPGNRFCGACGSPVGEAAAPQAQGIETTQTANRGEGGGKRTLFFSSIQAAKAKLVLIKGEGIDGESYALAGDDHRIGRSDADIIFDEDEYLSPLHANFFYVQGKLLVRDEGSLNGVYLRIRGTRPIEFNDFFLVGEQVMQVRPVVVDPTLRPQDDGTYLYSSPSKESRLEIAQVLNGGAEGLSLVAQNNAISLGREENDINFPDDPFISGSHARVELQADALTLTDLGSKNGTFIRITKETPLVHGDYVFMGQQLLRIEIV